MDWLSMAYSGVAATLANFSGADWAAWTQAVSSIIGIGIAIYVPYRIHRKEVAATERIRGSYKQILREAFRSLDEPLNYLARAPAYFEAIDQDHENVEVNLRNFAEFLKDAVISLRESLSVLKELDDIKKLDHFGAVRAIFDFRVAANQHLPLFEREYQWLQDHQTLAVLENAARNLEAAADELKGAAESVLVALE